MQDFQQNPNQQLLDQQNQANPNYYPGGNPPQVNIQTNIPQGFQPQLNAQMYPPQFNAQMNIPPQFNAQMNIPPQFNAQMNVPPQFAKPQNFPPNFPQNMPNMPPQNPQNIPKPEELFEMQKRIMAGERVNIFDPFQQQQQSNAYVLPPQCQPVGDKLIIPFSSCKNCFLEIFMIITSLMVISLAPTYAKIYTAVFFLIEQFCILFSAKKRIEIIKDEPNKKLTVKLINYLGMTRKTTEYDLGNLFVDVQIVDRKEGWQTPAYYRLILINTYKDGIAIDLDSSNIKNKPVSAFDFFEHVDAQKFNGQVNMKNTIQSFIGNNNEEGNPFAFNIDAYMKKQDNIFEHFTYSRDVLLFVNMLK
jgi:hypothetical protein